MRSRGRFTKAQRKKLERDLKYGCMPMEVRERLMAIADAERGETRAREFKARHGVTYDAVIWWTQAYKNDGLPGLMRRKTGPKKRRSYLSDIMEKLDAQGVGGHALSLRAIQRRLLADFGVKVSHETVRKYGQIHRSVLYTKTRQNQKKE